MIGFNWNRDKATQDKIRSEGAEVHVFDGEYDDCIFTCQRIAMETSALLILDTSFGRYTEIPQVCCLNDNEVYGVC